MTTNNNLNPPTESHKPNEDLRAAYAQAKQEITARDFPHYVAREQGIPLARVIEELEAIHQQEERERAQG